MDNNLVNATNTITGEVIPLTMSQLRNNSVVKVARFISQTVMASNSSFTMRFGHI